MINQIILVGRLTGDPEIEEYENLKILIISMILIFLDVYFGMEWLQTPRTIVNAET